MTSKEKMNEIKRLLKSDNNNQKKISKKELIDKIYADLKAKESATIEDEINEEDMNILKEYANSTPTNTNETTKSNEQLSEEAQQALAEYFKK